MFLQKKGLTHAEIAAAFEASGTQGTEHVYKIYNTLFLYAAVDADV